MKQATRGLEREWPVNQGAFENEFWSCLVHYGEIAININIPNDDKSGLNIAMVTVISQSHHKTFDSREATRYHAGYE